MLSISTPMKSVAGAVDYYMDQRKEDYYLNGVDKVGRWFGSGAERLNLGTVVERKVFSRLLNGYSPDGREALVQNAGRPHRQACWDMTFNAPKSVSVLWAMAEPNARQLVEQAHQQAVQSALRVAEEVAGITRRGPGGKIQEQAGLVWAVFQEGTSRAQDPHLHSHAVLCNLGLRSDGTTGSIATQNLFRWKMGLGAIYQAQLVKNLEQSHHLSVEPDRSAFRIREVPEQLCREFSQRRQAIQAAMASRGEEGALAAKTAAKQTRPDKEDIPAERLFPRWHSIGEAHGWGLTQAHRLLGPGLERAIDANQLEKLIHEAIQSIPASQRNRSQLTRQAARVALAQGAAGATLFANLSRLRLPTGHRAPWHPQWPSQRTTTQTPGRSTEPAQGHDELARPQTQEASTAGASQASTFAASESPRPEPKARQRPGPRRAKARQQKKTTGRRASQKPGARDQRMETPDQPPPGHPRGEGPEIPENPQRPGRQLFWFIHLRWKALYDKKPWEVEKGKFFHVHWTQPFENGLWSVARNIQVPTVGLELPYLKLGAGRPFVSRWSRIVWKKSFLLVDFRLQHRTLSRAAPEWSPFHRVTIPALRFKLRLPKSKPAKGKSKSQESKDRTQDHGHSH